MITIYKIKPKFQELLKPVLRFLYKRNVSANQITLASIILSALIGISFWFSDKYTILYLTLSVGLLIRMALNALDGMMARTYNQQSRSGEVLNEVGDIISDLFIYFPLLKIEHENLYIVAFFITLSIINEFSGLLGKVISNERRYDGPMGKSDRAFVISIYGILAYFGLINSNFSLILFTFIILLLIVSTYLRIYNSLKNGKVH